MANEIIQIAETTIGTSDPGSIGAFNLCTGLPLISNLSSPLGWQLKKYAAAKWSWPLSAVAAEASVGIDFGLYAGLCGPSFGVRFNADGSIQNGQITLTVKDDEAVAGMYLGVGLDAAIVIKAEVYVLFSFEWDTVLTIDFKAGIDVLKVAIDLIEAVTQTEDMAALPDLQNAVETPFAFIGESSNRFATNKGVIGLSPAFAVPINLWAVLVAAAAATVEVPGVDVASGVILAAHEALDLSLSDLGFGPTIGLSCLVKIQIKAVTVDGVVFNNPTITSGGQWVGTQADPTQTVPPAPTLLSVDLSHSMQLNLTIGLYAHVQVIEIWSVGATVQCDVAKLFDFPKSLTTDHSLANTIGSVATGALEPRGSDQDPTGLLDVRFV